MVLLKRWSPWFWPPSGISNGYLFVFCCESAKKSERFVINSNVYFSCVLFDFYITIFWREGSSGFGFVWYFLCVYIYALQLLMVSKYRSVSKNDSVKFMSEDLSYFATPFRVDCSLARFMGCQMRLRLFTNQFMTCFSFSFDDWQSFCFSWSEG